MPWYLIFFLVGAAIAVGTYWRDTRAVRGRRTWLALLLLASWYLGGLLQGASPLAAFIDVRQDRTINGVFAAVLLLALAVYLRRAEPPLLNAAALGLLWGDGIARVGCLLNGCDHGRPVPLGWEWAGIRYPPGTAAYLAYPPVGDAALGSEPCWPTPALEGLGCIALVLAARRWPHRTAALALVGWPLMRMLVEVTRGDQREAALGQTTTSLTALALGMAVGWGTRRTPAPLR